MRITTPLIATVVAGCLLAAPAGAVAQAPVNWDATDGIMPDDAQPAWSKTDSSSLPMVLGPTSLKINTTTNGENQGFGHFDAQLAFPSELIIEAGVWYVSGSSVTPVREAVSILITGPAGLGMTKLSEITPPHSLFRGDRGYNSSYRSG